MDKDSDRRIIESLPCGILQVSLEGHILEANRAACSVLGLTFDEISSHFVTGFKAETFLEDGSICLEQDHSVSKCLATHQP